MRSTLPASDKAWVIVRPASICTEKLVWHCAAACYLCLSIKEVSAAAASPPISSLPQICTD